MNHPKHSLLHALLLAAVVLSSVQHSTAIAASGVCDPKSFAPFQVISGTAETCATCLFPTYPYASSIDVAAYPTMDFTDRWIYFLGDVTVRQIYGEFAAIVHNAQVRQALTLRLLCNPGCFCHPGPRGAIARYFGKGLHAYNGHRFHMPSVGVSSLIQACACLRCPAYLGGPWALAYPGTKAQVT